MIKINSHKEAASLLLLNAKRLLWLGRLVQEVVTELAIKVVLQLLNLVLIAFLVVLVKGRHASEDSRSDTCRHGEPLLLTSFDGLHSELGRSALSLLHDIAAGESNWLIALWIELGQLWLQLRVIHEGRRRWEALVWVLHWDQVHALALHFG